MSDGFLFSLFHLKIEIKKMMGVYVWQFSMEFVKFSHVTDSGMRRLYLTVFH